MTTNMTNSHRIIRIPLKELEIRVIQVLSAVWTFGGWCLGKNKNKKIMQVVSVLSIKAYKNVYRFDTELS